MAFSASWTAICVMAVTRLRGGGPGGSVLALALSAISFHSVTTSAWALIGTVKAKQVDRATAGASRIDGCFVLRVFMLWIMSVVPRSIGSSKCRRPYDRCHRSMQDTCITPGATRRWCDGAWSHGSLAACLFGTAHRNADATKPGLLCAKPAGERSNPVGATACRAGRTRTSAYPVMKRSGVESSRGARVAPMQLGKLCEARDRHARSGKGRRPRRNARRRETRLEEIESGGR